MGTWDSTGTYTPYGDYVEEEVRAELWAMGALSRRTALFGRVPVSLMHREAGALSDTGGGLADISLGVRHEFLQIGEVLELPAIALTAAVLAPTGRAPDAATQPLGADTTGRGAFALSAGLSFEITRLPWFVRLDLGAVVPLPFTREDTGKIQRFGPEVDVAVSGGLEVGRGVVISLVAPIAWHAPLTIDGDEIPDSERLDLGLGLAGSVALDGHWTAQLSVDTGVFIDGAGDNTPARITSVAGLRYGYF